MRASWVVVVLTCLHVWSGLAVAADDPGGALERTRDLGHGFREETRAFRTQSGFEGLVHYSFLVHGTTNLGHVGYVRISPSGRYAFFQHAPTGRLFLFDTTTQEQRQLTDSFIGLPRVCRWEEQMNRLRVEFHDNYPPRAFSIE